MQPHAKYECSSPYGLSQVDFKRFPSLFLCKIGYSRAEPKYDPKETTLTFYDRPISFPLFITCAEFSEHAYGIK